VEDHGFAVHCEPAVRPRARPRDGTPAARNRRGDGTADFATTWTCNDRTTGALSVLDEHDGNVSAAARALGMARATLIRLLGRVGRNLRFLAFGSSRMNALHQVRSFVSAPSSLDNSPFGPLRWLFASARADGASSSSLSASANYPRASLNRVHAPARSPIASARRSFASSNSSRDGASAGRCAERTGT
jgi:hypothetical protein